MRQSFYLYTVVTSYLNSDPLQFGFKKDSGCNYALFTFSESVKFYNKRGNKAYCVILDASKAFDKVLINGMIAKLIKKGLKPLLYVYYIIG